ncbi:uncharacterized protein LOC106884254 [Octopus bimaculoides]|uniref:Uncharacterized protein n=1 Tax=Octopus bimaculoides TaxID=37653 RepID=A0A0L8I4G3_OCTBM|nr:uncharacterized protein LOC106884254 [Octopus bimaculoides]XP_014791018.1 uncharacterized protein LOC106884254 [Octopus bimaculoides]|eukprot:XP_014791017.1 PREDICTED: uncharacterized protein LOC106884254 [Octopus bimaculoides]
MPHPMPLSKGVLSRSKFESQLKSISIQRAEDEEKIRKERMKTEKLIGQLKAAEARGRLRVMRISFQSAKTNEINHLIACQKSALKAVRLQALVPPKKTKENMKDLLSKVDRDRVELLLNDYEGLLTNRTI